MFHENRELPRNHCDLLTDSHYHTQSGIGRENGTAAIEFYSSLPSERLSHCVAASFHVVPGETLYEVTRLATIVERRARQLRV